MLARSKWTFARSQKVHTDPTCACVAILVYGAESVSVTKVSRSHRMGGIEMTRYPGYQSNDSSGTVRTYKPSGFRALA
jgi:hypothetical protein